MKLLKKICLVILIMFMTSCSSYYSLELNDNEIKENFYGLMSIEDYNSRFNDSGAGGSISSDYKIEAFPGQDVMHERVDEELDDKMKVSFNYTYYYYNYMYSYAVKSCFTYSDIKDSDTDYYINLKGPFNCVLGDTVIEFSTDNKVVSHNADRVKNNKYTWNLKNKNPEDFEIIFHLKKNEKKQTIINTVKHYKFIILFMLLPFFLIGVIIYLNVNRNNKI